MIANTDSTLRSVCASMKMEGFQVSQQTQEDCRAVLQGEKSADEVVAEYIAAFSQKK